MGEMGFGSDEWLAAAPAVDTSELSECDDRFDDINDAPHWCVRPLGHRGFHKDESGMRWRQHGRGLSDAPVENEDGCASCADLKRRKWLALERSEEDLAQARAEIAELRGKVEEARAVAERPSNLAASVYVSTRFDPVDLAACECSHVADEHEYRNGEPKECTVENCPCFLFDLADPTDSEGHALPEPIEGASR